MLLVGAALISMFFLITLYTQQVLDTPSVRAQKKEPNLCQYPAGKGSETEPNLWR